MQHGLKMKYLFRLTASFLLMVSINVAPLNMAHAEKTDLAQYLWENRVLLVFSPSIQDSRFEAQVKELRQSTCDLQDRNMLVFQIINNAGVINLNGSTSKLEGDKFRKNYQVQRNDYRVILIGKDGGEKMRSHKVISVNEIFDEIDAMPMRQNEMASKQTSCR
jgi:hypothetical protein